MNDAYKLTVSKEIAGIAQSAPEIDSSVLERLMRRKDPGNFSIDNVEQMIVNGLVCFPKNRPDFMQKFYDWSMHHLSMEEALTQDVRDVKGYLAEDINLVTSRLPAVMPRSDIYEKVANDILNSYTSHRDDVLKLKSLGRVLHRQYWIVLQHVAPYNPLLEPTADDIEVTQGLEAQHGADALDQAEIVRKIWDTQRVAIFGK